VPLLPGPQPGQLRVKLGEQERQQVVSQICRLTAPPSEGGPDADAQQRRTSYPLLLLAARLLELRLPAAAVAVMLRKPVAWLGARAATLPSSLKAFSVCPFVPQHPAAGGFAAPPSLHAPLLLLTW
jgi:hypothetical protein